jgi:hypothetical protein
MTDYASLAGKSFKDLKNNPFLIILLILLSFGALIFIAAIAGTQLVLGLAIFQGALFSMAALAYWIVFGMIDTVLLFILIAFTTGARYGLFLDVAKGNKPTVHGMLRHGREHMKNMLTLTLVSFLLVILIYLMLIIIFFIVAAIIAASPIAGIIIALILGMLCIASLIMLSVLLIFTMPIVITQKIGGFTALMHSISYARANFRHAAMTALFVFLISLVAGILSLVVQIPSVIVEVMGNLSGSMSAGMWAIYGVFYTLSMLVSIISGIIITLFIFNSYLSRQPKKKR